MRSLGTITSRWKSIGARRLFREVNERGFPLPLGSVTKEGGVEFRADLDFQVWNPGNDVSSYKRVLPGDFVIGLRSFQSGIGASSIAALVSPAYTVLRPVRPLVHHFYAHLFKSDAIISQLDAVSSGIRQGRTISAEDALSLQLPDPTDEEKRAIADFLDAETARIDALIGAATSLIVVLREQYAAALHGAVTGAERTGSRASSGLPWCPALPDAWGVPPLKYVAKLGSGHTPSRSVPAYWVDCSIPWISLFDVGRMRDPFQTALDATAQQISVLGMANSSATLHPAGTVVLSRTASVGFSTVMSMPMAVSQHFATWTCGPDILPRYLLYLLRAMRQHWEALQVGTTNVTVFMPDLGAIRVPLPPIKTQQQAVDVVDRAMRVHQGLTRRLTRQLDLLRERRQALITAAVTGEIDVSTASGRGVPA